MIGLDFNNFEATELTSIIVHWNHNISLKLFFQKVPWEIKSQKIPKKEPS